MPLKSTKKTGIIILGHGSNRKRANGLILKVIREIKRKKGPDIIEPAYLQLSQPDLHTSIKKIAEAGCKRIIIVPFFLFVGNHVNRDIPRAIKKEGNIYKDIEFVYAKSLGTDSRISDIVFDCIKEAL